MSASFNTTLPQVTMQDYPAFVELCFDSGSAVIAKGPPGIGKTKGLEALSRRLHVQLAEVGGYCYCEINLANVNVADLQGYMMPEQVVDVDADGNEIRFQKGTMTYPVWAYDKFSGLPAYKFNRGMIVIEEYGQGGSDEKKSVQQLVEERRIGRWTFTDFDVALLSNRDIDRAGVTKDFDHAINRRIEFELVPTREALLVYGQNAGWTNMTLAFVHRNEADLFQSKVPDKQGPWLTPRSLEKLDRIIQSAERLGRKLDDPLVMAAAAGTVGLGAAGKYMAFVNARSRIPAISTILADPDKAPLPGDGELDIAYFLVFDLASKTDHQNLAPIIKYVKRMPSDMGVTYFNALTTRDKSFVSTKAFSEFAVDNLSLLTAIAGRK